MSESKKVDQWCFIWDPTDDPAAGTSRAALVKKNKWDKGSIINVAFLDGQFAGSFGHNGRREGELDQPWGIARDSRGRMYVLDTYNHRVQRFRARQVR